MRVFFVIIFVFGIERVDGALQKVGCYNTELVTKLPLYENFRSEINWQCTWPKLGYILNGCAVEAWKRGFTWFAVEYWGECRGGVGEVNSVLSNFPIANDCHNQVGPAHRMVVYKCDPFHGCVNPGYYDGKMPQEIQKHTKTNECQKGTDDCDVEHGICSDVCFGFKCKCKQGYELKSDGKTCKDINECETGQHNCDTGTEDCVNTDGSFRCKCKAGYLLDPDSKKCQFICDEKLDLGLIVDSSSSIEDNDFELLREFLRRFTNAFIISSDKTQTGLVRFSDDKSSHTKVIFDFLKYHNNAKVADAVSTFERVSGQTLGDFALFTADKKLFVPDAGRRKDDPKVTSVAVVITDGKFKYSPKKYANILKSHGVHIIAVAISNGINYNQMLQIVTDQNKDVFRVEDFQQLVQRVYEIAKRVCEV